MKRFFAFANRQSLFRDQSRRQCRELLRKAASSIADSRAVTLLVQNSLESLECFGCRPKCGFAPQLKSNKEAIELILEAIQKAGYSIPNIHCLCNFHAWGLAAVQDAFIAAQVFIKLVA
ncbi:MAG: hypothetical protein WBQ95_01125 [Terracidiphilus sp.]